MADALLSAAAERLISLVQEQASYHINLIKGAEKEVQSLAKDLETITNVLDDAENRRFKDKNINSWLSRLERTSYEMEDVLDKWKYELIKQKKEEHQSDDARVAGAPKKKVCSFIPSSSCLCFKRVVVRHEIACKIVDVKAQLDEILKDKKKYGLKISKPIASPLSESLRDQSTSLVHLEEVYGRDIDGEFLVSKLVDSDGSREESGMQVVSVVGVGGLGKTTLAQVAYNHSRVEESFKSRIWICVSDPFDLASIAKRILESEGKGSLTNTESLDVLFKHVKESISGKRFLLVLDDVWTEDCKKWETLKNYLRCGGSGSKILVTTRSERVAKIMDSEIFHPGLLSDEDCWSLLCRMALSGKNALEFENVGKKIVKKCNGLPLAAKTLGSLLRFKSSSEEWEYVLNSEIWKMKEVEVEVFSPLLLSYNELSPTLKRCFSYCAVFPKDFKIDVESLIENWMALGYLGSNTSEMELKGRECFSVLAMRSLFQNFQKDDLGEIQSCKMHDIVHDFALFLRKSGGVDASGINEATCQVCDTLLVSSVNEFCTLYCNMKTPPNLCDCLVRLRVLSLTKCGLQSIPQGMEKLIHLRWLNFVGINKLSCDDLNIIFQLYNLQTLVLMDCGIEKIPKEIENLSQLRSLNLKDNKSLKELPSEIGNLIQLRSLDLNGNTSLKELPSEIGNLIHLRSLDLGWNNSLKELPNGIEKLTRLRRLILKGNKSLKELPSDIGNLIHLRCLDLLWNESLKELPESICGFQELQILNTYRCESLCRLPEGLAQLTSLRSLDEFKGGNGWSKLGILKNLNQLRGTLKLHIRLGGDGDVEEVVKEAREAELRNKRHLERLVINFKDPLADKNEEASSCVRMDVIDALEPHSNLRELAILYYKGSKLGLRRWMVSPLNQLRQFRLYYFDRLTSLPPLGRLPFLEDILIDGMSALEVLGREFLGITTRMEGEEVGGGEIQSSSNANVILFPKLKILRLWRCRRWKEWEDITAEEEESPAFQVMPCLTELYLSSVDDLTALPHRLLRKAPSLRTLRISYSEKLLQRYTDKRHGSSWRPITETGPWLWVIDSG